MHCTMYILHMYSHSEAGVDPAETSGGCNFSELNQYYLNVNYQKSVI